MDSSADKKGRIILSSIFAWALLAGLIFLFFSTMSARADQPLKRFQVHYPTPVHSGDPIKIQVRFSSQPPAHVFFQLELTVDGQPVAMADLSEERSTWITAPPQTAGIHHFAVIWRNPPEGSPEAIQTDLSVLPKK